MDLREGIEEESAFNAGAARVLALLQEQGRFVDFICEDISAYDDEQVGAAARDVHAGCRKVILENFDIRPIRSEKEESIVTLLEGYNPAEIDLIGKLEGGPPYRGILQHHGWRAERADLPGVAVGHDPRVLAKAVVEVQ